MIPLGNTGVMKSTPTKTLEVLMNFLPVESSRVQEALITAVRLRNVGCWTNSVSCLPELSNAQYFFGKSFKVFIPPRELCENGNPLNVREINMFTDGSKMDRKYLSL